MNQNFVVRKKSVYLTLARNLDHNYSDEFYSFTTFLNSSSVQPFKVLGSVR